MDHFSGLVQASAFGCPQALLPSIIFEEGGFVARLVDVTQSCEVTAFQRLRYDYFVRQRGWVVDDPLSPGCEVDRYDAWAQHLAVFDGGQIVAYLRVQPWQAEYGWMLEHEFLCLLPSSPATPLLHHNAVELTRLVIANAPLLPRREARLVTELLFKLLYQISLHHGWEQLYIVVEQAWLPIFRRRFGLAFEPLGCPCVFPDGTVTVAAHAGISDLEIGLRQHDPEKLHWYQQEVENLFIQPLSEADLAKQVR